MESSIVACLASTAMVFIDDLLPSEISLSGLDVHSGWVSYTGPQSISCTACPSSGVPPLPLARFSEDRPAARDTAFIHEITVEAEAQPSRGPENGCSIFGGTKLLGAAVSDVVTHPSGKRLCRCTLRMYQDVAGSAAPEGVSATSHKRRSTACSWSS
jgi:hypothetical protein